VTGIGDGAAAAHPLLDLLEHIEPWDDIEEEHRRSVTAWIASGAPLYRTRAPDVPPKHLVSYVVVLDEQREEVLLVAHRKAGLWLPAGGHVEPGEDPWHTTVRECLEELRTRAEPTTVAGTRPFFVTVTPTRGPDPHTDVSLWYLVRAQARDITWFDTGEFDGIRWLSLGQVLAEPAAILDPHMHRFTRKLRAALHRMPTFDPTNA
jgi:8-oxo-dGTP pyrophosphatase MutT (NUDIX family)